MSGLVATMERFVEYSRLRQGSDGEAMARAVNAGAPGLDKARAALAIYRLLLRSGIGEPSDADDQKKRWSDAIASWLTPPTYELHVEEAFQLLVKRELEELSSKVVADPTIATWPPSVSAVERMLLAQRAPSDLTAWAASFELVDDAWSACRVAEWMPHLAQARGLALADMVSVLARIIEGAPRHDLLERQLQGRNNQIDPGPSWSACAFVLRMLGRTTTDAPAARERWEAEMSERIRVALAR